MLQDSVKNISSDGVDLLHVNQSYQFVIKYQITYFNIYICFY